MHISQLIYIYYLWAILALKGLPQLSALGCAHTAVYNAALAGTAWHSFKNTGALPPPEEAGWTCAAVDASPRVSRPLELWSQVQLHRYYSLAFLQAHLHPSLGLILARAGDDWNHQTSVCGHERTGINIWVCFFFWLVDVKIGWKSTLQSVVNVGVVTGYCVLQGQLDNKWQHRVRLL